MVDENIFINPEKIKVKFYQSLRCIKSWDTTESIYHVIII